MSKKIIVFFTAILTLIISCRNPVLEVDIIEPGIPSISPSGGQFSSSFLDISISSEEGASIYYTLDGSTPSEQSNRFTGAFRIIDDSVIVKAIAVVDGNASSVAQASFMLNYGRSSDQLGIIKGRVALPAGINIPLESVQIYSDLDPNYIVSPDSSGAFYLEGLDPDKSYTLYLTTSDVGIIRSRAVSGEVVSEYAKQLTDVKPSEGAGTDLNLVKLKLTGSLRISATLFDKFGEAETDNTGVLVYIPGTSFSAFTDSDGHAYLPSVPEGVYTIRAERSGYTFVEREEITILSDSETDLSSEPFNLYTGSGSVTGTVVFSDSVSADVIQSYEGITVLLKNIQDSTITYTLTSDADGNYSFSGIEPGAYMAQFTLSGYQTKVVEDINVIGARVSTVETVYLIPVGGAMSGTVTLSDGGENGHGGITILAEHVSGTRTYSTVTNSAGEFLFANLAAGTYSVTASRVGYSSRIIAGLSVISGQNLTGILFDPLVETVGTVTGIATLEGSSDSSGISVLATHTTDNTLSYSSVTDVNGVYILSDVEPGTYRIQLSYPGYITKADLSITVNNDLVVTVPSWNMQSNMARISGTVLLESALEHSGVTVLVIRQDVVPAETATAATDTQGRFFTSNLNPGTYRVQASKDGYQTVTGDPLIVSSGQSNGDTELTLPVSTRSISGQILLEDSTNHSGIKITATNLDNPSLIYSALSNSSGYFALASMQPGSYLLAYSRENYVDFSPETVDLSASSSTSLAAVTLELQRGSITGIVTLEGRIDHSGITVTLPGTEYETLTDISGSYTFDVPAGNYPGGVRFSRTDFQISAETETVTVLNNSTYAVPTHEIPATHNRVSGEVNLEGTDDNSGILVVLEGTDFSFNTEIDGVFQFDHVPLGTYTLRLSRENTPDVTVQVDVIPAEAIETGLLNMRPNAASIEGYAELNQMSSHGGVTVTVTTAGITGTLSTTTSPDGYFYLGNLLSTGSHTVVFSRTGWESETLTVDDLTPLEIRDLTGEGTVLLSDTTAPDLSDLAINDKSTITSNPEVTIEITAEERGSGIDRMQISWDGTFDTEPFEPYYPTFSRTLPGTGNGDRTLYIRLRDYAGNVSNSLNTSILLSDQVKTYSGVLGDADLLWEASEGVVIIAGNLLIPEGKTLVIQPGVEIRFNGDFYIRIDGTLSAVGTEASPIVFTTSGDFAGQWSGIIAGDSAALQVSDDYSFDLISGSEIAYARILNTKKGVQGRMLVRDSYFETSGYVTNSFTGFFVRNEVLGQISFNSAYVYNNQFLGRRSAENVWIKADGSNYTGWVAEGYYYDDEGNWVNAPGEYYGEEWDSSLEKYTYFQVFIPSDSIITGGSFSLSNGSLVNNIISYFDYVDIQSVYTYQENQRQRGVHFTTLVHNNKIGLEDIASTQNPSTNLILTETNGTIDSNSSWNSFANIAFSNIYDNWGSPVIQTGSDRDDYRSYNFRNNFWGYDKTLELESVGAHSDVSFIEDYYDDFNISEIDYSDWADEPWDFAGYRGDAFVDFSAALSGGAVDLGSDRFEAVIGTPVELSLSMWTNNSGSRYRIAQTIKQPSFL
ncbi:MAG: carboxypeptidase regulatory-like domain-containing protein [Spirochaetales bacterium]|nr:carboxypeptidase regulatory-like domain-containing protein [Spirochaetales bacterium]